jgi:RNA polymerase subunit RPABC4/transcription elongation factor Spt4
MASYKQPCIECGAFIERNARFCPVCGSTSPFVLSCPTCLREVSRSDKICGGCGRPLTVTCPKCGAQTFVGGKCGSCGASLLIPCQNKRCGSLQFFENEKCTACGKKLNQ